MKVGVVGLWHLGSVTAACLASLGHEVYGFDSDPSLISQLRLNKAPIHEPGLDKLIEDGQRHNNLSFLCTDSVLIGEMDVVWICFDTEVDSNDIADTQGVKNDIKYLIPFLKKNCMILVSSQLPVGTISELEDFASLEFKSKNLSFGCLPENLRLGNAIQLFLNPDRIIVGLRPTGSRKLVEKIVCSITENVIWMSVESAEMTKHAINSFLATSIVFANEISSICEKVGADAKEVELGLKSDLRIGLKSYLSPGEAYAGGTLARDVRFVEKLSSDSNLSSPLLRSIRQSNDEHKEWVQKILEKNLNGVRDKTITIWGLTYKTDTDTLRRSQAINLAEWLSSKGAKIQAYDPMIKELPEELTGKISLYNTIHTSLDNSNALVICTPWPIFKTEINKLISSITPSFSVIDPRRLLEGSVQLFSDNRIEYFSMGYANRIGK